MNPIKVYCSNLPNRKERYDHIEQEFKHKPEFVLNIVPAVENKNNGAAGLYQTFLSILEIERNDESPYFIFVEDDHKFNEIYSFSFLNQCIAEADSLNADILVCGPSFIHLPIQCSERLFWAKVFNGTQFVVLYKRIFNRYEEIISDRKRILDISLSEIFERKFVMYPSISQQEFFGYSDATPELFENSEMYLKNLFAGVDRRMAILNQLRIIVNSNLDV